MERSTDEDLPRWCWSPPPRTVSLSVWLRWVLLGAPGRHLCWIDLCDSRYQMWTLNVRNLQRRNETTKYLKVSWIFLKFCFQQISYPKDQSFLFGVWKIPHTYMYYCNICTLTAPPRVFIGAEDVKEKNWMKASLVGEIKF